MDIKIAIPDERVAQALHLGYESGVHYWCKHIRPFAGRETLLDPNTVSDRLRQAYWPIYEGMWILKDSVSGNHMPLTTLSLTRGLEVIAYDYSHTLRDIIDGDITPKTGDTLIQCSVFGKVIYGRTVDDNGHVRASHLCSECRQLPPCECQLREALTKRPTVMP